MWMYAHLYKEAHIDYAHYELCVSGGKPLWSCYRKRGIPALGTAGFPYEELNMIA